MKVEALEEDAAATDGACTGGSGRNLPADSVGGSSSIATDANRCITCGNQNLVRTRALIADSFDESVDLTGRFWCAECWDFHEQNQLQESMDEAEEDDEEEADDGIYHHSFEFTERPEECELMIRIGNIEHQKGIEHMQKVLEWAGGSSPSKLCISVGVCVVVGARRTKNRYGEKHITC